MINETTIDNLINGIINQRKKVEKDKSYRTATSLVKGMPVDEDEQPLPDYWPGYRRAVKWLRQCEIHAQKGVFPDALFRKTAPNQTEKEREYVRENYKQITLNVFKDLVDTYGRAYHENNWSIDFLPDDDQYKKQDLQTYLEQEFPIYGSLENFTFNIVPPLKLMDAMGVVTVMPYEIPVIENENGEMVVDPEKLIRPFSKFYHVTRLMYMSESLCIIESDELSEVYVGEKPVREGLVYLVFTKEDIYKWIQTGKKDDFTFEPELILNHMIGELPVKMVEGFATQIDNHLMQQSPFLYATDILDEALLDATLLRGIKPTCAFPYRVMYGDPCEFQITQDGQLYTCDNGSFHFHDGRTMECNKCNGTGMKDRVSPLGQLLLRPPTGNTQGDMITADKAMFYASPSPEMPRLLRDEVNGHITQAYDALHIKNVNKKIQGAEEQTATESAGHQKALIASISLHTRQMFDLFEWQIKINGRMRYGDQFKMPSIKRPTSYDFILESELLIELNLAITAGQPPIIIQSKLYNYLQAMNFSDVKGQRIFALIAQADRIMTMSSDEIMLKLARGLIAPWQVTLHDSALPLVNQLIRENPKFLEQEFDDQLIQLVDLAKKVTDETTVAPIQTTFSPEETIQRILAE